MALITVGNPEIEDEIIERFADPERLSWMRANFVDFNEVRELGDADSYATRLHNYAGTGLDQVRWVSDRLRSDPLPVSTQLCRDSRRVSRAIPKSLPRQCQRARLRNRQRDQGD